MTLSYSKISQKVTVDIDPGILLSMSNIFGFNNFFSHKIERSRFRGSYGAGFYSMFTPTSWNHM